MKLALCLVSFLVAVVSIHSAHLGLSNRKLSRSASDSNSASDVSTDNSISNSNEDMSLSMEDTNCVMTQTCVFLPNLLLLDQPTFGAFSVALGSIDVTTAAASVRQLIEEANSGAGGNAEPPNPCLSAISQFPSGPITFESNFLFDVDIINTDGTTPALPPNTPTSNLNVTITYRDLMSFDRLQITFQLDNSGLPINVQYIFFATTANNGTITFPSAMAVSATNNPGLSCTTSLPLICGQALVPPTAPTQTIPDLPTVEVTQTAAVAALLASQRQC